MRGIAAVIGGATFLAGYACYQALRKERGAVAIPLQRLMRRHRSVKLAPAALGGRAAAAPALVTQLLEYRPEIYRPDLRTRPLPPCPHRCAPGPPHRGA